MANSTGDVSRRSASNRPVLVPGYVENLNAIARMHGLRVSAARIIREEVPQGGGVMKWEEHLAVDWQGTGAQLRSLGWILPSWSFPVATARGPGCRRLDTKWGVGGYVHVPVNEDDVTFAINHGDVPLKIAASAGVETISMDWCTEHHGTQAALIAAGIADAQRLSGKKPFKSNGQDSDEPRWWRLLQPDGTVVFGIETDLAWRRRAKETERMHQNMRESRRNPIETPRFESAEEWKRNLAQQLDSFVAAYNTFLGQSPARFQLDPESASHMREILQRSRAEMAEAFVGARVRDTQRAPLRLVIDNTPNTRGGNP